jgi:hypothetical protein
MNIIEDSRQLAEWLGWTNFHLEWCADYDYLVGVPPDTKKLSMVPNFIDDESANALLLDKLLDAGYCLVKHGTEYAMCFPAMATCRWPEYYADRKTAVFKSALSHMNKIKKQ